MTRLLGAALVAVAAGTLGLRSAACLRERAETLGAFLSALDLLRAEICGKLAPLPEVMELAAERCREPAASFFRLCVLQLRSRRGQPFQNSWNAALAALPGTLTAEELRVLEELGGVLGRFDGDSQGEALLAAKRKFEGFLQRAETRRDREGRTRAALGLAVGAAAAILLI